MDWDEHREKVNALVEPLEQACPVLRDPRLGRTLSHLLYAMSELGLWHMDVDSIDVADAVQIWAAVELARTGEFPEELVM